MGRVLLGIVLIIAGLSAFLDINIWQFFWPGVLIIVGLFFLMGKPGHYDYRGSHRGHWQPGESHAETKENQIHYSATFQGIDRKINSDDFKGGVVNSTFGGVNLDLRNAKIKGKDPVVLKVDATLGGIKIMVPKTWKIDNDISGIAGGVNDATTIPQDKDKTGTLKLFGQATLGGVEITN